MHKSDGINSHILRSVLNPDKPRLTYKPTSHATENSSDKITSAMYFGLLIDYQLRFQIFAVCGTVTVRYTFWHRSPQAEQAI